MAAFKPEVVFTQSPVEISTPFQMLNYVSEVDRHEGSPTDSVTWQPTLNLKMATLKPEVVLTLAPVEISTPFQMLN